MEKTRASSTASLRWAILRRAFLTPSNPDHSSLKEIHRISRKALRGFNLIPCHIQNGHEMEELGASLNIKELEGLKDAYLCYRLPVRRAPTLFLIQRVESHVHLNDFEICNRYDVDNTGLVCGGMLPVWLFFQFLVSVGHINELLILSYLLLPVLASASCGHWPSEDILAYFCLTHAEMFRSKRILELGSGYGLAGLAIAAGTDATEVVISDGNPQVVDYIQRNIQANAGVFGETKVKSMILHWKTEQSSNVLNTFDVIIASDCTFFKEFHEGLAHTVKSLLKHSESSEALFFAPRRGDSLDKFLEKIGETGLKFEVLEIYDSKVWKLHLKFLNGDDSSWPNYDKDHCYPILELPIGRVCTTSTSWNPLPHCPHQRMCLNIAPSAGRLLVFHFFCSSV